mgnify:CR=1 FL=1
MLDQLQRSGTEQALEDLVQRDGGVPIVPFQGYQLSFVLYPLLSYREITIF